MKILKFKKNKDSKYILYLDNGREITLFEDTILKYDLLLSKTIDVSLLNELLEYDEVSSCYNDALKYILKKMRSKMEVRDYLSSKSYNDVIIDSCIKRLVDNNLLNEETYSKSYVNDRFYLSKDGPNKIINDLENMGIEFDIIQNAINNISEDDVKNKIIRYIDKKKNNNTRYSSAMLNKKIKEELITLGFNADQIDLYLFNEDDMDTLNKEYLKVYKRYSSKYSGYELNMKIKSYLYSKGYKIDDINKVINE